MILLVEGRPFDQWSIFFIKIYDYLVEFGKCIVGLFRPFKMKKFTFLLVATFCLAACYFPSNAQIIMTVAGKDTCGFSGDGGPATTAKIQPSCVTIDAFGNIFFSEGNNWRVRKINKFGIISTVAGGGGTFGDGGPATAAQLNHPAGVAVDVFGNLFIADANNNRIRKVDTSGIISTVAGNGIAGFSGDGGQATSAQLNNASGVAVDASGNIFIADNNRIRKVNTSGIISTVVGNGVGGFSGDGGTALSAQLNNPSGVVLDASGNIFIADRANHRIRKVNTVGIISTVAGNGGIGYSGDGGNATDAHISPTEVRVDFFGNIIIVDNVNNRIRQVNSTGIINTVAGNGMSGFAGDGGLATAAQLNVPTGGAIDDSGNIFIADLGNCRIRKFINHPDFFSDSFGLFINNLCSGPQITFELKYYSAGTSIVTTFGDASTSSVLGFSSFTNSVSHAYTNSGSYTIKHVLYHGTTAVDSIHYTYNFKLCNTIPIQFYYDANNNFRKDSSEPFLHQPVLTEIDSNGIAIDTISSISGINYRAYGVVGDIYQFKVLSAPSTFSFSYPITGILTDTLQAMVYDAFQNSFGFSCTSSTGFDLSVHGIVKAGRHMEMFDMVVNNAYCTPIPALATLHFSPKYVYHSAYPAPASISGTTITWNLDSVSAPLGYIPHIQTTLTVPSTWLLPGDTVNMDCMVTPTIGDTDTSNNNIIRTDTIKSSFDPNEMSVSPKGLIGSGTQLEYAINFENTGNDTAFNINIMDTLDNNVLPHTMRIVVASAVMNISMLRGSGGENIIKFDFPNINLLDSSHHNQCDGIVMFNINTRSGLPEGTTIDNRAGIYFDDNPVVMTNTVENIIKSASVKDVVNTSKITLYPNPATNELTIKTDGSYHSFSITNMMGQEVLQQNIVVTQTIVNVKILPVGVYYVTFRGEGGSEVRKMIKI